MPAESFCTTIHGICRLMVKMPFPTVDGDKISGGGNLNCAGGSIGCIVHHKQQSGDRCYSLQDPTFFSCYWCKNTETHGGQCPAAGRRPCLQIAIGISAFFSSVLFGFFLKYFGGNIDSW